MRHLCDLFLSLNIHEGVGRAYNQRIMSYWSVRRNCCWCHQFPWAIELPAWSTMNKCVMWYENIITFHPGVFCSNRIFRLTSAQSSLQLGQSTSWQLRRACLTIRERSPKEGNIRQQNRSQGCMRTSSSPGSTTSFHVVGLEIWSKPLEDSDASDTRAFFVAWTVGWAFCLVVEVDSWSSSRGEPTSKTSDLRFGAIRWWIVGEGKNLRVLG